MNLSWMTMKRQVNETLWHRAPERWKFTLHIRILLASQISTPFLVPWSVDYYNKSVLFIYYQIPLSNFFLLQNKKILRKVHYFVKIFWERPSVTPLLVCKFSLWNHRNHILFNLLYILTHYFLAYDHLFHLMQRFYSPNWILC